MFNFSTNLYSINVSQRMLKFISPLQQDEETPSFSNCGENKELRQFVRGKNVPLCENLLSEVLPLSVVKI